MIPIPADVAELAEALEIAPERVRQNCHAVSLLIVQTGLFPDARVARGSARGVLGQHSWVVHGDPYDKDSRIIDATLWSYDSSVKSIWTGTGRDGVHVPHGSGHVLTGNPPSHHGGETIHLTPSTPLSPDALRFLRLIGAPLDYRGWHEVAHLPVGGWPAREVIEALLDTPSLAALVPIDVQGMLTNRNPGRLYLR